MSNDIKGPLLKGEYVLATKYHDGCGADWWGLGFFDRMEGERFMVVDGDGKQTRGGGYRRCERISRACGDWLWSQRTEIEAAGADIWAMVAAYNNEVVAMVDRVEKAKATCSDAVTELQRRIDRLTADLERAVFQADHNALVIDALRHGPAAGEQTRDELAAIYGDKLRELQQRHAQTISRLEADACKARMERDEARADAALADRQREAAIADLARTSTKLSADAQAANQEGATFAAQAAAAVLEANALKAAIAKLDAAARASRSGVTVERVYHADEDGRITANGFRLISYHNPGTVEKTVLEAIQAFTIRK